MEQSVQELTHALANATSKPVFDKTLKSIESLILANSNDDESSSSSAITKKISEARKLFATNQTFIETINNTLMNPKQDSETVARCAFISARLVETLGATNTVFNETAKTTVYAITKALEVHNRNIESVLHLSDLTELLLLVKKKNKKNDDDEDDEQQQSSSSSQRNLLRLHFSQSNQLLNAIVCILRDFSTLLGSTLVENNNNNKNGIEKNTTSQSKTALLESAIDFLTGALLSLINNNNNNNNSRSSGDDNDDDVNADNGEVDNFKRRLAVHPELVRCFDSVFENCSHLENVMLEAGSTLKSLLLLLPLVRADAHQATSLSSPTPATLFSNEYSLRFLLDVLAQDSYKFRTSKAATVISDCLVILTSSTINSALHKEVCEVLTSFPEELISAVSTNIFRHRITHNDNKQNGEVVTASEKGAGSEDANENSTSLLLASSSAAFNFVTSSATAASGIDNHHHHHDGRELVSEDCVTSLFHLVGKLTSEVTNPSSFEEARSIFTNKKIGACFIKVLEEQEQQREESGNNNQKSHLNPKSNSSCIIQNSSSVISLGVAISNMCNASTTSSSSSSSSATLASRRLFTSSKGLCNLLTSCLGSNATRSSSDAVYAMAFAIHSLMIANPVGQERFTSQALVDSINRIFQDEDDHGGDGCASTESIFAILIMMTTLLSDSNPRIHDALDLFSGPEIVTNIARSFLLLVRSPESAEQIGQLIFVLVHPVNQKHRQTVRETLLGFRYQIAREEEQEETIFVEYNIVRAYQQALEYVAASPQSCERIALSLCQLLLEGGSPNAQGDSSSSSSSSSSFSKMFCEIETADAILAALCNFAQSEESIKWLCTLIVILCSSPSKNNNNSTPTSEIFTNFFVCDQENLRLLTKGLTTALLQHRNDSSILQSVAGVWRQLSSSSSSSSLSSTSGELFKKFLSRDHNFVNALATSLENTNVEDVEVINTLFAIISLHIYESQLDVSRDDDDNDDCVQPFFVVGTMIERNQNLSLALINKLLQPDRATLNNTLTTIITQFTTVSRHLRSIEKLHETEILETVTIGENFSALANKLFASASTQEILFQVFDVVASGYHQPESIMLDILIKAVTVACFVCEGNDELWKSSGLEVAVETAIDKLVEVAVMDNNNNNFDGGVNGEKVRGLKRLLNEPDVCPNLLEECALSTRGRHVLSSCPRVRRFMMLLREEGAMEKSMEKILIVLKSLVTEADVSNPFIVKKQ